MANIIGQVCVKLEELQGHWKGLDYTPQWWLLGFMEEMGRAAQGADTNRWELYRDQLLLIAAMVILAIDDLDESHLGESPPGFTLYTVVCDQCGQVVAQNWLIRHLESGCTMGGQRVVDTEEEGDENEHDYE